MNSLDIQRATSEFFRSLWRNRWVSLGTTIAMAMVFFLTWLVVGVKDSSELIIDRVEKKVDIGVFFQAEAPEFLIDSFLRELDLLVEDGNIVGFEYFSKEYALEEMKEKFPGKVRFLERYQFENPLQASVEIIPGEWSPNEIFEFLEQERFESFLDMQFFDKYEQKKLEVNRILQMLVFFRHGGIFLVLVFLGIAVFLIGFFVSSVLHQKKREIFIMRLVGATHSFIRLPFVMEGVVLALIAFLLSFGMFLFFLDTIAPSVGEFFPNSSDNVFITGLVFEVYESFQARFWWDIIFLLLGSGAVSFFTVERFVSRRHLLGEE